MPFSASVGNAVDGQLAVYLYDADLFITSDKRLFRVLEAIRPYSPQPFAMPVYLQLAATVDGRRRAGPGLERAVR